MKKNNIVKNHTTSHFFHGIEKKIWSIALKILHVDLLNTRIIIVVPFVIVRIQTFSCIMPEVNVSRMVNYPN